DLGNLGPHGERVEATDAARVLDDLCEVLEWYLQRYTGPIHSAHAKDGSEPGNGKGLGESQGAATKLKYFCYISRSKISQLYDQLEADEKRSVKGSAAREQGDVPAADSLWAMLQRGMGFGSRHRLVDMDPESAVEKLDVVLGFITRNEKVLDL